MRAQIIQCQCDCHASGGLHFAPCCQGECRKCGNSFSSRLAEHEATCRATRRATAELVSACRKALASLTSQVKYIADDVQALGHNCDAMEVLGEAVAKAEGR